MYSRLMNQTERRRDHLPSVFDSVTAVSANVFQGFRTGASHYTARCSSAPDGVEISPRPHFRLFCVGLEERSVWGDVGVGLGNECLNIIGAVLKEVSSHSKK